MDVFGSRELPCPTRVAKVVVFMPKKSLEEPDLANLKTTWVVETTSFCKGPFSGFMVIFPDVQPEMTMSNGRMDINGHRALEGDLHACSRSFWSFFVKPASNSDPWNILFHF